MIMVNMGTKSGGGGCEGSGGCEPVFGETCRGCGGLIFLGCEINCELLEADDCGYAHCEIAAPVPNECVRSDRRCTPGDRDACYDGYTCRPYPEDPAAGVCAPDGG